MECEKEISTNSQESTPIKGLEHSDSNTKSDVPTSPVEEMEGIAKLTFPLMKKKKGRSNFLKQLESFKIETGNSFSDSQDPITSETNINKNVNKIPKNFVTADTSKDPGAVALALEKEDKVETFDIDLNFEFAKKKRKKSKNMLQKESNNDQITTQKEKGHVEQFCDATDLEYTYEYLLTRCYHLAAQEQRGTVQSPQKLTLNPPQVFRVGTKKTSFANFLDICKVLHRPPQHLMSFVLVELGTLGSLDGNNHLIIKGRFQQKQVENVLRRYIKEYVRCLTCSSMNTVMQKEIRLNFITCETCESKRSVATIKSGFQAVTNRRASIRAKNAL